MTSQVAIFNMNGIAVASDTVATSHSTAGSKTTNNAEKIYPLGDEHLVVALHYGSSALNDLHHQFHFNRWRESLTKPFEKLEDYVENYVEWTSKNPLHGQQSEFNEIFSTLKDHFGEIIRRTQADLQNETTEDHWESAFERLHFHAKEGLSYLKKLERLKGITLESATDLIAREKIDVKDIFKSASEDYWVLTNHPTIPAKTMKVLKDSAPYMLVGNQDLDWDSFLAFIGYGTKDFFGGSTVLQCRGILNNHLVYSRDNAEFVAPENRSRIVRYAQSDAIESFIQGYNSDIMGGFMYAFDKSARELEGVEIDEEVIRKIIMDTREYIEDHSWRVYVRPMLNQIANMNAYSLSELARTLVGLQATASQAKAGPVSVGGLIEVLTIDRTRGIQWRTRLP